MTDLQPVPLPLDDFCELDLQFGRGLVAVILEPGVRKIQELRTALTQSGKHLPRIRTRDNTTLAPFSFLLHHNGRLIAEGDFATLGDILQALARTAVPPPPKIIPARSRSIVTDDAVDDPHCVIVN